MACEKELARIRMWEALSFKTWPTAIAQLVLYIAVGWFCRWWWLPITVGLMILWNHFISWPRLKAAIEDHPLYYLIKLQEEFGPIPPREPEPEPLTFHSPR